MRAFDGLTSGQESDETPTKTSKERRKKKKRIARYTVEIRLPRLRLELHELRFPNRMDRDVSRPSVSLLTTTTSLSFGVQSTKVPTPLPRSISQKALEKRLSIKLRAGCVARPRSFD